MTRQISIEGSPAYNSTLAIGGVSSPVDSFVVVESSVLRTNFCAEKPDHRKTPKTLGTIINTTKSQWKTY